ncbi:hypothetical protein GGI22_006145 [Coemansia erecta]|nr:hypothetical protein GGI22_006145 [Coemansia erecta]
MSQQAMMAQANVQQASYNPFAQRQTMYMDTSSASAAGTGNFPLAASTPFGNVSSSNTIMVSQTTVGGGFGNNNSIGNTGALAGYSQQQQQQQQQHQMHMRTTSSAAMSSNGNFANFDVFK